MHVRKGMGISTILGLALGIGVLLVIGVSVTSGSLGQSLDEGFGILENRTDYSIELVNEHGVSAEKRLSDAAMYVYQRGAQGGCADGGPVDQQIQDGGYPGLQGTYLTQTPKCSALTENPLRGGIGGLLNPMETPGQDTEGIFGRVYFHIPENAEGFELKGREEGGLWLERHMMAGARGNIMVWSVEDCNKGLIKETWGDITDFFGNADRVTYQGTGDNYVFFFPSTVGDRVDPGWASERLEEKMMYCTDVQETLRGAVKIGEPPVVDEWGSTSVDMTLCPGDRGYIQVNKGKAEGKGPRNEGESGVSITDEVPTFPHIQIIRSQQEDCEV